jgi:peptidoglycan/LPS O-acetylase OafA/YrhL
VFKVKLNYRPEIDGLRTIAVGAVILYHAKISAFGHQLFEGGFIGVDIFFVISGYLITSIILKELIATDSFSFKHFYERRIRRILPVLLVVMLVSFPFAWMYLLPSSFVDFSKTILYSLGFSSNFYFHYSGQVYGAESALLKPFLHTWSLSIEEQFYIIFPVVLLITFKFLRKYLIHVLLIGFVISLGLADWGSRNHPSFNFYVLPTRIWELLAGSILAYFEITKGQRSKYGLLNLILPTVGIILIGHSVLFFNDEIFHPSFYTLSPIIGVCLIIWFSNKSEIVTKILSTKLFVGIGLISYSLYLWHYPIFAFARTAHIFDGGELKKLLFGIITLILSIISYNFIEKPFRNKKYYFKRLIIILISLYVSLIGFSFYIINESGIKTRFPKIFQVKFREYNVNLHQKDNTQKIILIGDSHSAALEYNLNEEVKKNDLSLFRYQTRTYLKDFNFVYRKTKKIDKNFVQSNNKIDKLLKKNSNSIVILHHRWSYRILETYFDNEEGYKEKDNLTTGYYFEPIGIKTLSQQEREVYIRESLVSRINHIIDQGNTLILVYPVPEMGFNVPRLLLSKYIKEKLYSDKFSTPILSGSYNVYKKRNKFIFEILDSIKSPNIYRVYPHELFCNKQLKNRCVANDKENLFYADDSHLSVKGSEFVIHEIMKTIENIEIKSK